MKKQIKILAVLIILAMTVIFAASCDDGYVSSSGSGNAQTDGFEGYWYPDFGHTFYYFDGKGNWTAYDTDDGSVDHSDVYRVDGSTIELMELFEGELEFYRAFERIDADTLVANLFGDDYTYRKIDANPFSGGGDDLSAWYGFYETWDGKTLKISKSEMPNHIYVSVIVAAESSAIGGNFELASPTRAADEDFAFELDSDGDIVIYVYDESYDYFGGTYIRQ